jgi:prolyl oligopeptidase
VVRLHDLDGQLFDEPKLPSIGAIGEFRGSLDEREAFYSFTSFNTPTSVWRYDIERKQNVLWRAPEVKFDPAEFVTEQVFCRSRDGTRVPLFVTRRRDVVLSPSTPTLLYGYGGFNIAIKPAFSPAMLVWMERGGCYVSANLRGGSEYGREWHAAGTRASKQNVFDDFIAAAEFLVAQGWTSPKKLAIHGRSNGGLLVGACLTQRPDLFGAAVPGVGVLDMLRYHRFTIGWAWASDYGRSDAVTDFPWLRAYSPLHNVKSGVRYPATLIITGDHDDRVVPAHSFKFAAELQHAQGAIPGAPPTLIRIETRGGHGAGKPTSMQIEEWADVLAFLDRALAD